MKNEEEEEEEDNGGCEDEEEDGCEEMREWCVRRIFFLTLIFIWNARFYLILFFLHQF